MISIYHLRHEIGSLPPSVAIREEKDLRERGIDDRGAAEWRKPNCLTSQLDIKTTNLFDCLIPLVKVHRVLRRLREEEGQLPQSECEITELFTGE